MISTSHSLELLRCTISTAALLLWLTASFFPSFWANDFIADQQIWTVWGHRCFHFHAKTKIFRYQYQYSKSKIYLDTHNSYIEEAWMASYWSPHIAISHISVWQEMESENLILIQASKITIAFGTNLILPSNHCGFWSKKLEHKQNSNIWSYCRCRRVLLSHIFIQYWYSLWMQMASFLLLQQQ